MAKAIKQIKKQIHTREEVQEEAVSGIVNELANNSEAILTMIGIVKNLHEMGALDTLSALIEKRNDVGVIAVQQLNKPEMHKTIKNGINAFNFLGTLNPDQLKTMLSGLSKGLERAAESVEKQEKPSLWELGKRMRNPETRATMSMMTEFLQGMGEGISDVPRHNK
ncbi:DUF1641 domain-containing protein [Fictibacillus sp. KIGAM418]|uniref:DUF1641 domain-containing protein n=1 Tax=Fictibacillus marinisediminis TaxID=2878389 RepID=A0A9X1XE31_9BACL|nr:MULTISPECIES: DUF1641 domain-containing protein [Fictibacillus]MCK6258981.1 DUF1641 domain-containing protein [Fictibacillus marinisediminis]